MGMSRDQPPEAWTGWGSEPLLRLTDDLYYGWSEDEPNPYFWHWCTPHGRWRAAGTADHELVSREPLHLEPSLLWACCNMHGWVRNGEWTDA